MMFSRVIFACCAFFLAVNAQELSFFLQDEIDNYSLSTNPVIQYENDILCLRTTQVMVKYPLKDMHKFTVKENSSSTEHVVVSLNGDYLISFFNEKDVLHSRIIFTKKFESTSWLPFYVPFSFNYEKWKDVFEFASIDGFSLVDNSLEDELNRIRLNISVVSDGNLLPNHPYLIRAKKKGLKRIILDDVVLNAANSFEYDFYLGGYKLTVVDCFVMEKCEDAYFYNGERFTNLGGSALKWGLKIENIHPQYATKSNANIFYGYKIFLL